MPLYCTLSTELIRLILRPLPERTRVQFLLANKETSQLLALRKAVAQAALDGLKAELENEGMKHEIRGINKRLVYHEKDQAPRGIRHSDFSVYIDYKGVISIDIETNFFAFSQIRHRKLENHREFHPWMKSVCDKHGAMTLIDDSPKHIVEGALYRSSY